MRVLGLDYGDVRVGVAVSDGLGLGANGLPTISRKNPVDHKNTIEEIGKILHQYEVQKIVLGYPKNMDGTEGENCRKVQAFAKQLGKAYPHVTIDFFDERLTSISALQTFDFMGAKADVKRKNVDKMAAQLILQGYLDKTARKIKENEEMADKDVNLEIDDLDEIEVETIVMTDDEGNEIEYIIIDEFEQNETTFLVMIDAEEVENDEVEAVIFKQVGTDEENFVYEEISEEEYDKLEPVLKDRLADFDFE
ncbi:MAG: Holliday junction resolvase RuvX [Defluviitaleaceae bacterium]|nr:Holliday junction resolvase RuvX [Defluviitaleaceae bacterium]